jgi:hypothetical protein
LKSEGKVSFKKRKAFLSLTRSQRELEAQRKSGEKGVSAADRADPRRLKKVRTFLSAKIL